MLACEYFEYGKCGLVSTGTIFDCIILRYMIVGGKTLGLVSKSKWQKIDIAFSPLIPFRGISDFKSRVTKNNIYPSLKRSLRV